MSADPAPGEGDASASFVSHLRARPVTLRLAEPGVPTVALRVQSAELWDALRFEVTPATPVIELKRRALAELHGEAEAARHEDYVLKLNGFEVLDEAGTVAASGARDGSTYLIAFRRRRPVR